MGLLGLLFHIVDAFLSEIDNIPVFITLLLLNRVIEGFSFGLIQSTIYGVASQELTPIEFDKYARACSSFSGVGCCISLILGPFLFSIGGYFLPYFILSSCFLILFSVIYFTGVLNDGPKAILEVDEELYVSFSKSQTNDFLNNQIDLKLLLSMKVNL